MNAQQQSSQEKQRQERNGMTGKGKDNKMAKTQALDIGSEQSDLALRIKDVRSLLK